nr:MAG TPA: hypothetical protein [Caudoviricetes sp.]
MLTYNLPPVIVYISIVILSFMTYRTTFNYILIADFQMLNITSYDIL